MEQTNKIILKGTIIHMETSRKRIMYTLATNTGTNRSAPDVAVILKENIKKEDIQFVPGDRVKLIAHVQYTKQIDEENKKTFLKTLVVDQMGTAELSEQDEFNLDTIEPEDVNKCMFVGKMVHKYDVPHQTGALKIITLSVRAGGFFNYIDISAFGEHAEMLDNVQEGEYIVVVGEVRTRTNPQSDKMQNIVCTNLKKISPEDIKN